MHYNGKKKWASSSQAESHSSNRSKSNARVQKALPKHKHKKIFCRFSFLFKLSANRASDFQSKAGHWTQKPNGQFQLSHFFQEKHCPDIGKAKASSPGTQCTLFVVMKKKSVSPPQQPTEAGATLHKFVFFFRFFHLISGSVILVMDTWLKIV